MNFFLGIVIGIILLAITQIVTLVAYQFVFVNITFWLGIIAVPPIIGLIYKCTDLVAGQIPYINFKFKNLKFYNLISITFLIYGITSIFYYPYPVGLSAIPKWVFILNQIVIAGGAFTINKKVKTLVWKNKRDHQQAIQMSILFPKLRF
ncbi:hypothetical protein QG516_25790 [Pedobacter gandavensis]|uniref:hypothetical protein n=1 Tax=Pedobacter gandavensis TaxID=2679963 RepID=UPI002479B9B6|nr:hypothetical protein [Pedobacter gandavensis]WGQ09929.1 hypothetical protein QG516_25790 [Pedobacter gandavensis]